MLRYRYYDATEPEYLVTRPLANRWPSQVALTSLRGNPLVACSEKADLLAKVKVEMANRLTLPLFL